MEFIKWALNDLAMLQMIFRVITRRRYGLKLEAPALLSMVMCILAVQVAGLVPTHPVTGIDEFLRIFIAVVNMTSSLAVIWFWWPRKLQRR